MPKPTPDVMIRRRVLAALLGLAALGGGCAAPIDATRASPPYPAALVQARTLDIQVFRHGNTIGLTNTTATPIGPGRLWLNSWYSRPVEEIGVGQTREFRLSSFHDRNGEPFRGGGGFFAARDPESIVLAQIVQPAASPTPRSEAASQDLELLGLIVVGGGPTN